MTPLEAVRAKVIEAVPEIMDPKFGCRTRDHKTITEFSQHRTGPWVARVQGEDGWSTSLWVYEDKLEAWKASLLGRPITLADVLRAIEGLDGPELAVNNEGQFFVFLGAGNGERSDSWEGTTTAWNLALPLDEQEPEVIDFLAKILTGK